MSSLEGLSLHVGACSEFGVSSPRLMQERSAQVMEHGTIVARSVLSELCKGIQMNNCR